MFPWGAIVSLAGSAASGIMSAINNKRSKEVQDQEYARQQAEAKARAYEDPISRSENQRILNEYDRLTQRQVENQRNAGIITGETQEAALARQKAAIQGRADLMGDMAAGASANKDYYLDRAEQSKRNQALAEQQRLAERNQTYANLAANAASAFGNIVDSYGTGKVAAKKSATPITTTTTTNSAKLRTGMAAPTNLVEQKSADAYVNPTNLVQQAADELKKKDNVTKFKYPLSIFSYPKKF